MEFNRLLTSQYMTQGHFIVGSHAQIETHTWLIRKMFGPFGIPHIRAPQTPNYELSPAKQVLAWETAPWDQAIQIYNTHLTPAKPMLLIIFATSDQEGFNLRSFNWGATHESKLMRSCHKMFDLFSIPYFWGISGNPN